MLTSWRLPALALAGMGVAATGAAALLKGATGPVEMQATPAAARAPAVPGAAPPPRFDLVRVAPNGAAVLAGRAEPGAQVTVRDGEREFGRTLADPRGYWMLMPAVPLPPGGRELTLSSRTGDGAEAKADGAVLLVVPEPAHPAPAALAVLVPDQAPPRVLQSPQGEAKTGGRLGLDAVDYGERGDVRFAGSAPPGAPVRVYVDDVAVGDAVADGQGRWAMTPGAAVPTGLRRLRVDQLSPRGRVSARVELPFQRSTLLASAVAGGQVVVQPGQNLWQVARKVYGSGVRYTVIYQANRDQIRDPARIYPGQAFSLPAPP